MKLKQCAARTALVALVYVASLVAMLPASLPAGLAASLTHGLLEVRGASGSAWSGTGRLFVRGRSAWHDLGPVRWQAIPQAVLSGGLAADVLLPAAATPMRAEWRWRDRTLEAFALELPAEAVAPLVPALEALEPEGTVVVRSPGLRLQDDGAHGVAQIEWRDLRLARLDHLSLGSHRVDVEARGANAELVLRSMEGPLKVEGRGTWSANKGLEGSGSATLAAPDARLERFLAGVCPAFRQGVCRFALAH